MQAATIIVDGGKNFREDAKREKDLRIDLVSEVVRLCPSASVIQFPAGYFFSGNKNDAIMIADKILAKTELDRRALVFGADTGKKPKAISKKNGADIKGNLVLVIGGEYSSPLVFHQIAARSKDNDDKEKLDSLWHERQFSIPENGRASILICGEVWCPHLRKKVLAENPGLDLVLLPAHRALPFGRGKRVWSRPINSLSEEALVPIMVSEHRRSLTKHEHIWPLGSGHRKKPNVFEYNQRRMRFVIETIDL